MKERLHFLCLLLIGLTVLAGCGDPKPNQDKPIPQPPPPKVENALASADGPRLRDPASWQKEAGIEETTIDALARIGSRAVPALIELLNDPNPELRAAAARAIARIGPAAVEAVPSLIQALQKEQEEPVRGLMIRALGQIGPAAAEAVPTLIEQLQRLEQAEK